MGAPGVFLPFTTANAFGLGGKLQIRIGNFQVDDIRRHVDVTRTQPRGQCPMDVVADDHERLSALDSRTTDRQFQDRRILVRRDGRDGLGRDARTDKPDRDLHLALEPIAPPDANRNAGLTVPHDRRGEHTDLDAEWCGSGHAHDIAIDLDVVQRIAARVVDKRNVLLRS